MTLGGAAHSAPAGISGNLTNGSGFSATNMVKARCLPSGAQVRLVGVAVSLLSLVVCWFSVDQVKICAVPSLLEMYARRLPSGDQRGEESLLLPVVMNWWLVPSRLTD